MVGVDIDAVVPRRFLDVLWRQWRRYRTVKISRTHRPRIKNLR